MCFRGVSWCDNDTFISSQNQLPFTPNLSSQWSLCHCCLALPLFTSWIHPRPNHNGHDHIINFSRHVWSCKVRCLPCQGVYIQIHTFSALYTLSKCNSVLTLHRSISAVFEALAVSMSFSTLLFFSISVRKWHFSITHIWVSLQSAVIYFFASLFHTIPKSKFFLSKYQL